MFNFIFLVNYFVLSIYFDYIFQKTIEKSLRLTEVFKKYPILLKSLISTMQGKPSLIILNRLITNVSFLLSIKYSTRSCLIFWA